MSEKNSVSVLVGGKVIQLSGYESEEYLQQVAGYMDRKMKELSEMDGFSHLSQEMRNILLALNIADDYHKARRQADAFDGDIDNKDDEIYTLKQKIVALQMDAEAAQKAALAEGEKAQKEALAQAEQQIRDAQEMAKRENDEKIAQIRAKVEEANRAAAEAKRELEAANKAAREAQSQADAARRDAENARREASEANAKALKEAEEAAKAREDARASEALLYEAQQEMETEKRRLQGSQQTLWSNDFDAP